MELAGRVAIVTGGGTGIGRATALRLAKSGAKAVVVNYSRSAGEAETTAKDVIALGNVAGAMVFQSTVPVTLGVLLTPWVLGPYGTVAAVFALLSALLIFVQLRLRARDNSLRRIAISTAPAFPPSSTS